MLKELRNIIQKELSRLINELDYRSIYANVDPWDNQAKLIDYFPAEGENIDHWFETAMDPSQRKRFLMDDDEFQVYRYRIGLVKAALDKAEKGESLTDFEKKVVRFYKSNKQSQKRRISNTAFDRVKQDFVKTFDTGKFMALVGGEYDISLNGEPNKMKILDQGIPKVGGIQDSPHYEFNVDVSGENGVLKIYNDASFGVEKGGESFFDTKTRDKELSVIVHYVAKTLQKAIPEKAY